METERIIAENKKRKKEINKTYNPLTGEGCTGVRVRLKIKDAPIPLLYIPEEMAKEEVCRMLAKHGSITEIYKAEALELTEAEKRAFWTEFCELRIRYDFEFFAYAYQTIEDGDTAENIPFGLKRAQREFLEVLERMRLREMPIRAIVLKARQMGLSTVAQLYMEWIQTVHRRNWHSVICAHVKDSATNIRAMFDKVIENMPTIGGKKYTIVPFKSTQNIKYIPERGCRITIGSAEKPESVRGQNPRLAHFSEVAFYPDTTKKGTAQLIGSIVGPMKRKPYTMVVYESTANGVGDFFHSEWEKAKRGESAFEPVFLAWYYDDRYSEPLNGTYYNFSGKKTRGNMDDFVRTLSDYELALFRNHPACTLENINWYRGKCAEMSSPELMKQEYPGDDIEAFQDAGLPAFRAQEIEIMRAGCKLPGSVGELVANCSPALARTEPDKRKGVLQNIRFVEDCKALEVLSGSDPKLKERKTRNKLKIWEFPDKSTLISNRYVVVFDPQKGISEKADWGVIAVFDRYWMMHGGKPEIVAEWRGRIDKDIAIWVATQVACYYNNALLVVESNTYDAERSDNDTEFIFDTIAGYYGNLYSRTPADKIIEGEPERYGFNTNRSTKPMIIANYVAMLREQGYVERCTEALDEARVYEQKPNGSFGAKDGKHDDILMTRMIGCHICYELPLPTLRDGLKHSRNSRPVSEASF